MLAPQTVIENEFISVVYHPDSKIVHHQVHKFVHGTPLQEALAKGTDLLEKHKATKWLSDDRRNSALTADDAAWSQSVWFPRTLKAGWKYWAVVQPEAAVGQMNMSRWVKQFAGMGITARMFTDPDEAYHWLESL